MTDTLQDHIHTPDPYTPDDIEVAPTTPGLVQFKRQLAAASMDEQRALLDPMSSGLQPVQGKSMSSDQAGHIHQAAAEGTAGSGSKLPHYDRIQQSFGGFDVSGVQAYTGSRASQASESMGALAYATGSKVAFKGAPDLHTAAHEAAHIVQQSQGVSLDQGVGKSGDVYEKHADAVADRVVSGQSAEDLLAGGATGSAPSVQHKPLQKKPVQKTAVQRKAVQFTDPPPPPAGTPPAAPAGPTPEAKAAADQAWNDLQTKLTAATNLAGVVAAQAAVTTTKEALRAAQDNRSLHPIESGLERAKSYVERLPEKEKSVYEQASSPLFFPDKDILTEVKTVVPGLATPLATIARIEADWAIYEKVKTALREVARTAAGLTQAQAGIVADINSEGFKRFGATGTKLVTDAVSSLGRSIGGDVSYIVSLPKIDEIKAKCTEARALIDAFEAFANALGAACPVEQRHKTRITDLEQLETEITAIKAKIDGAASSTIELLKPLLDTEIPAFDRRLSSSSISGYYTFIDEAKKKVSGALANKLLEKLHTDLVQKVAPRTPIDNVNDAIYQELSDLASEIGSRSRAAGAEIAMETEKNRIRQVRSSLRRLPDTATEIAKKPEGVNEKSWEPSIKPKVQNVIQTGAGLLTPSGLLEIATDKAVSKLQGAVQKGQEDPEKLKKALRLQAAGDWLGLIPVVGNFLGSVPSSYGKYLEKIAQGESVTKAVIHAAVEGGQGVALGIIGILVPGSDLAMNVISALEVIEGTTGAANPELGKLKLQEAKTALEAFIKRLEDHGQLYVTDEFLPPATLDQAITDWKDKLTKIEENIAAIEKLL